ncbi:MAG TPA: hypothetical protein VFR84_17900, partial [Candidatus Angelobacter sp.]|nr:hypothetical protein [Candidatus Angelobacter sp.]
MVWQFLAIQNLVRCMLGVMIVSTILRLSLIAGVCLAGADVVAAALLVPQQAAAGTKNESATTDAKQIIRRALEVDHHNFDR